MRLSRRRFLKGLAGTAAGVLIAPEVLAEPERRVFALDRTMVRPPEVWGGTVRGLPDWLDRLEPYDTPLMDMIVADQDYNYHQRFEWGWDIQIDNEIMRVVGAPFPHPTTAHTVIPVIRGRQPHVLGR